MASDPLLSRDPWRNFMRKEDTHQSKKWRSYVGNQATQKLQGMPDAEKINAADWRQNDTHKSKKWCYDSEEDTEKISIAADTHLTVARDLLASVVSSGGTRQTVAATASALYRLVVADLDLGGSSSHVKVDPIDEFGSAMDTARVHLGEQVGVAQACRVLKDKGQATLAKQLSQTHRRRNESAHKPSLLSKRIDNALSAQCQSDDEIQTDDGKYRDGRNGGKYGGGNFRGNSGGGNYGGNYGGGNNGGNIGCSNIGGNDGGGNSGGNYGGSNNGGNFSKPSTMQIFCGCGGYVRDGKCRICGYLSVG